MFIGKLLITNKNKYMNMKKPNKQWRHAVHGFGVVSLIILDREINIPKVHEYCDLLYKSEFANKSNYLQDLQNKFEQRFIDLSDNDLILLAIGLMNIIGDFDGMMESLRGNLKGTGKNILPEFMSFMKNNYVTNLNEYNGI